MILNPVVPLEEWDALLLDLLEQHICFQVQLNELLLVLVAEDMGQEGHVEEFMVGVFTCGCRL